MTPPLRRTRTMCRRLDALDTIIPILSFHFRLSWITKPRTLCERTVFIMFSVVERKGRFSYLHHTEPTRPILNFDLVGRCFIKVIIFIQTTQRKRLFRLQRGKPFSSCHQLHVFWSSLSWYLDTRSLPVCHPLNGQTTRRSHKQAWGPSNFPSVSPLPYIP